MYLGWIVRALLLLNLLWVPVCAQQTDSNATEGALLERLERNRRDLGAYTRLYQLYLKQGRTADAERMFLRGLNAIPPMAIAPAGTPPALAFGDFYLAFGKLDQAMQQYRTGMADKPAEKLTYQKRQIEVLMRQGKRSEAAELAKQILRERPNDPDARGLAANLLLDKGDLNGALAEFQALAVGAPENPLVHYNLGRVHAARGEWEAARYEFDKCIELKADFVPARLMLAQLQVSRGEFDDASKTAGGILAVDSGNETARMVLAVAQMGQKKSAERRQASGEIPKFDRSSVDAAFQLGVASLAEKQYPEAEVAFRLDYQMHPANARGLIGMAETAMAQNRTDAAFALLQAEADKAPKRADLQVALGDLALRAARYDLALATFQKVLRQTEKGSASQGDLYVRIGETYNRMGDAPAAIQALQKAREALPNNVAVLSTLAVVLDGAGRKAEAGENYEAALRLDPNHAASLNNLAFLLAETGGDLDRALTLAQHARQLMPDQVEVSDTLGWVYLKKGMGEPAIEIFLDLVAKSPDRATYRYHLAMAYHLKGDQSAALREARAAAEMHTPEAERREIQALIAELSGGR
jgi:tetratricopeptide (TPR) repeat protein